MALPSIFPLMSPAFFNSFKCCETVGCARGNSLTISPQIQVFTLSRYSIMATLAGWPSAFNKIARSFCLLVKCSVLVAPILICILQYYDIDLKQQIFFGINYRGCLVVVKKALMLRCCLGAML